MTLTATGTSSNEADPFDHLALLYADDAEFVERMAVFVGSRLAALEPVLVALPLNHLELVQERMAHAADEVRWVDMTDAGRNPGRILPGVLSAFADEHDGRRVSLVGECIWQGRSRDEYAAAVQHEALINLAFAGRPATILCPYDTQRLPASAVLDAARTHPELVQAGTSTPSEHYADPVGVAASAFESRPRPPADAAAFVIFDEEDLGSVRTFAGEKAIVGGMKKERLFDLRLAVHEVALNTVVHGATPGMLLVWNNDSQIMCEFHDRGQVFDPLVGRRPPAAGNTHGHGLLLVNQLCDLVQFDSNDSGTTVRLYFSLR